MATKIIMNVGIVWDKYQPNVESRLTRDLIGLLNASSRWDIIIQVINPKHEADSLLKSLEIQRLSRLPEGELPNLYITYQSLDKKVVSPNPSVPTISRILYMGRKSPDLSTSDWHGMSLKEQDRSFYNSQFRRAPPPNNQWSTLDPLVTMVWSR